MRDFAGILIELLTSPSPSEDGNVIGPDEVLILATWTTAKHIIIIYIIFVGDYECIPTTTSNFDFFCSGELNYISNLMNT